MEALRSWRELSIDRLCWKIWSSRNSVVLLGCPPKSLSTYFFLWVAQFHLVRFFSISYLKEEEKVLILFLTPNQSYWSQAVVRKMDLAFQGTEFCFTEQHPSSILLHSDFAWFCVACRSFKWRYLMCNSFQLPRKWFVPKINIWHLLINGYYVVYKEVIKVSNGMK